MSIIKNYLKNASWYVFGSAIQGLTPFLLTPFLTRTLSQAQFSEFVLFIAIGTVLSFFFALGLPAALTRELILDKSNSDQALLSVNLVKRYLLLIALALILLALFLTAFYKTLFLALALSLSLAVVLIDMAIYRAQQLADKFVYFAIFSTAIPTMLMTIGIYLNWITNNFVLFYGIFVVTFALTQNLNIFRKLTNNNQFPMLLKLGWPTIPHGLGMSLMQYGDRVLIAAALGFTAAGKVQVAALIGSAPLLLLSTLNHAWIPGVLEKFNISKSEGVNFINKSTKFLAVFIFSLALLIMLINPLLLNLFAPADYDLDQLSPIVVLMATTASLYIFYLRNTHILTYIGRFQSLAWITPISISLQILVIFATAPLFGLVSVGLALIVMVSSQVLLTQIVVAKLAPDLNLTKSPLFYFVVLISVATIILI